MSQIRKVLTALALAALIAGPAWALPTLSAHLPTLTSPTQSAPAAPGSPVKPLLPLAPMAGITVKDPGTIATKWSNRAGAAQGDYQTGVQAAAPKWQANAAAAGDAFSQGVQAAIAKNRFALGITGTAAAKFTKNAGTVGPARYAQGVQNGQASYQTGVQPYLDTIKSLDLPARGPKGSAGNYNRAQLVAQALRTKKVGS